MSHIEILKIKDTILNKVKLNEMKEYCINRYYLYKFNEFSKIVSVEKNEKNYYLFKNNYKKVIEDLNSIILNELKSLETEEIFISKIFKYTFFKMFFNLLDKKLIINELEINEKSKEILINKYKFD
jgi:hypothetical protein